MNPTTQQVIEFLALPELHFGAEEDVLLLSDPESLREQVASLLKDKPRILGQAESENLKARLGEADWSAIVQEFQARVDLATKFFDTDAKSE